MSRIGREPIAIPEGVTITVDGSNVTVKGKLGTLTKSFHKGLSFEQKDGKFLVNRPNDSIEMRMNHGTTRALINDMVKGVSEGFKKVLEIKGVGYRAEMKGNDLVLYVGHSHADVIPAMDGVKMTIDTKNLFVIVEGIDKQKVGQQAAVIRETKKPECYHGKGIRYQGEVVVLRQPASAKKSA
jgi:large subunit ribosomal protein L6